VPFVKYVNNYTCLFVNSINHLEKSSPSSPVGWLKTATLCAVMENTLFLHFTPSIQPTVLVCQYSGRRDRKYSILHILGSSIKHLLDNLIALTNLKIDAIFSLLFLQYLCQFSNELFLFCQRMSFYHFYWLNSYFYVSTSW